MLRRWYLIFLSQLAILVSLEFKQQMTFERIIIDSMYKPSLPTLN